MVFNQDSLTSVREIAEAEIRTEKMEDFVQNVEQLDKMIKMMKNQENQLLDREGRSLKTKYCMITSLLTGTLQREHITPVLASLHWLPASI